ncbi:MAG: rRNA maturation RNase YbeY [Rhabdochlamydiaceae bacterium]
MKVSVFNSQKDLQIPALSVKKILKVLSLHFSIPSEEVSVYFVSERKISRLHEKFFQDPSPTDCISFPLDINSHLGEIFVCPKTAISFALENALDPLEETYLYIIHGFLHLLGYDDLQPSDKKKMRYQEKVCLKILKKHNLL